MIRRVAKVQFQAPETLNSGIAFVAPDLVYVATDDGVVQALTIDTANKTLVRDDSRQPRAPAGEERQRRRGQLVRVGRRRVTRRNEARRVVREHDAAARLRRRVTKQLVGTVDLGNRNRSACGSIRTTPRVRTSTSRSGKITRRSKST